MYLTSAIYLFYKLLWTWRMLEWMYCFYCVLMHMCIFLCSIHGMLVWMICFCCIIAIVMHLCMFLTQCIFMFMFMGIDHPFDSRSSVVASSPSLVWGVGTWQCGIRAHVLALGLHGPWRISICVHMEATTIEKMKFFLSIGEKLSFVG